MSRDADFPVGTDLGGALETTSYSARRALDAPRTIPPEVSARYESLGLWTDLRPGSAIASAAVTWPRRVALVVGSERLTFEDLEKWTAEFGARLRNDGVGVGDRVLIQLPNSPELVVAVIGAWRLGAVPVPVVPMYRTHEMSAILDQVDPVVVVSAARLNSRSLAVDLDRAIDQSSAGAVTRYLAGGGDLRGWRPFPALPSGPALTFVDTPRSADECSIILFTSGTTSAPKGVRHDGRSLGAEVASYRDGAWLSSDDVVFIPSPLAHVGAIVASALLPSQVGCSAVVMEQWDPGAAMKLLQAEEVTFAIGAPVFLSELLDDYERDGGVGHRVRKFHTGAAPTGADLVTRAAGSGVQAWRAWGMTEAPTITHGSPDDPLDRRGRTDGRIESGSEVEAVDEQRRPLPRGVEGELRLRSPKIMMGYLIEEQTLQQVDAEGWLYTGDLGVVDHEGWVTITGRIKDIINRGGEKFSAADIERAIDLHPSIAASAVTAEPDERLGETVKAYVVLRPGHAYPGAEALVAHLEELGLARQKFPVAWAVLPKFPVSATGKVQKRDLAAAALLHS